MKKYLVTDPTAWGAALILACFTGAAAAEGPLLDIGKREYDAACAVCHGVDGRGDGPFKGQLTKPVPDLRGLSKGNYGVFPFDRVYQVIDGRAEVAAHGARDMPIWGDAFRRQSSIYFENYPPQDSESNARSRILALTEYLFRLQEK